MLDNLKIFFLPCSFTDLRLVIPKLSVIPEVFSDLPFLGSQSWFLLLPPPPLLPLPSPLPPRKKTKQQQQKNWRLLCRLWLAILWNVYAWVNARKENGGDGPGAGEIKVCPCYTDSSIMSSKVRKSRHLCKFNGMMQNCTKLIACSLLCARTVCSVIYYLNHTDHPPNAPFLHAVSPHKSKQNCTSWQWCSFIFSTRVNLVKQDGPKIYKYRRRNR